MTPEKKEDGDLWRDIQSSYSGGIYLERIAFLDTIGGTIQGPRWTDINVDRVSKSCE